MACFSISDLAEYFYSRQKDILLWVWTSATAGADLDSMQAALLEYAGKAESYKATNYIVDERSLGFAYTPALQAWINAQIAPRIQACGGAKIAVVRSSDISKQVALTQIFDQASGCNIKFRMFETIPEAEDWINSRSITKCCDELVK